MFHLEGGGLGGSVALSSSAFSWSLDRLRLNLDLFLKSLCLFVRLRGRSGDEEEAVVDSGLFKKIFY